LANELHKARRYQEALEAYDKLLDADPGNADLWFYKADCLECLDRLEESLAAYDRSLELAPDVARTWADRAHVLNRLKRNQESLASATRAVELAPDNFRAWFNRAEQERSLGLRDAARLSFARFLECVPAVQHQHLVDHASYQVNALQAPLSPEEQSQVLAGQAEQAAREGRFEHAEALLHQAVALAPAPNLHNLGLCMEQQRRFDEAEDYYRQSLAADPSRVDTALQLARNLRRRCLYPQAVEAHKHLLGMVPDDERARVLAAESLMRVGQYNDVLTTLEGVMPDDPETNWLRGVAYLGLNRPAEGLAALERVPETDTNALIDRGLCLERLGRLPEAIACYERGFMMSGRRWLHLARHDQENAADYFGRAVEALLGLDRNERLSHMGCAELAYARKKLAELAPAHLEELVAFDTERRAEMQAAWAASA
jgi:tetratricopeptide (TPR) repeat protein